jgi:hypothetical protein
MYDPCPLVCPFEETIIFDYSRMDDTPSDNTVTMPSDDTGPPAIPVGDAIGYGEAAATVPIMSSVLASAADGEHEELVEHRLVKHGTREPHRNTCSSSDCFGNVFAELFGGEDFFTAIADLSNSPALNSGGSKQLDANNKLHEPIHNTCDATSADVDTWDPGGKNALAPGELADQISNDSPETWDPGGVASGDTASHSRADADPPNMRNSSETKNVESIGACFKPSGSNTWDPGGIDAEVIFGSNNSPNWTKFCCKVQPIGSSLRALLKIDGATPNGLAPHPTEICRLMSIQSESYFPMVS